MFSRSETEIRLTGAQAPPPQLWTDFLLEEREAAVCPPPQSVFTSCFLKVGVWRASCEVGQTGSRAAGLQVSFFSFSCRPDFLTKVKIPKVS